jgi:hypothetical protein
MTRRMLVLSAISWTIAGGYALVHIAIGDLLTPAVMAIALLAWLAIRIDELTAVLQGETERSAPTA